MSLIRIICLFIIPAMLAACGTEQAPPAGARPEGGRPQLVGVATVETRTVADRITRPGTLRARRTVRLHNQEEGRIREMPWYEGDRVRAGETLVRLEDSLLQAELRKARARLRQAEQDLARLRRLVGKSLISEEDLMRAETALDVARAEQALLRARLEYMHIRAPFDGVVTERLAEPGDAVPRHTHLLTIADPASLVTEVRVSELHLPSLEAGEPVEVRIDALGDRVFAGRVLRVHPTVDPRTRQGTVEVLVKPVPAGARAGQLCRVTLSGQARPRRLIPLAALRRDAREAFVFVVDDAGTARRTRVRSGGYVDDQVEIVEGLEDGAQVVTRGFLGLTDGMPVRVVEPAAAVPDPRQDPA